MTMTKVDLAEIEDPIPAVYTLWKGRDCIYVGHSQHLRARLRQHSADKDWDHLEFYLVPDKVDRLRLEGVMILALRPLLNKGLHLGLSPDRVWELAWSQYARPSGAKRRGATAKPRRAVKKKAKTKEAR